MTVHAFWWSPTKSARILKVELEGSGPAWGRLLLECGHTLHNFGDDLTPRLIEYALGERVRWAPPARADLIAVGSILELYAERGRGALVWGSGARRGGDAAEGLELRRKLGLVAAVRGPRTRAFLGLDPGTPLGDPGILWARALGLSRNESSTRPSLLPHYRVWQSGESRSIVRAFSEEGFRVIEPSRSPEHVASAIASSEYLVTSSLHGVIVAHSLGVPVVLTSFDADFSGEPPFKYTDYFESLGLRPEWSPVAELLGADGRQAALGRAWQQAPRAQDAGDALAPQLLTSLRSAS